MTEGSRIIGDIIEINQDIVQWRIDSKAPKFIKNLVEKYYRHRLKKSILSFDELILDKFNLQELFTYINTYYSGNYRCINSIGNIYKEDDSVTIVKMIIKHDKDIISYTITINHEPTINISYAIVGNTGIKHSSRVYVTDLWYDDNAIEYSDQDYMLKELNTELVETFKSFLFSYLKRFEDKGYKKEVKS